MSRRAERRRRQDMLGIALIVAAIALVAGVGAAATLLRTPEYDSETLCLKAGAPPAETVLLVDATDRLDVRHLRRLKTIATQEAARLPRWGKLTVLSLRPDVESAPRTLFSACTPGDRASANPLWENLQRLETQKRTQFDEPLAAALSGARGTRSADGSPIVEGLFAAAAEPGFAAAPKRRLVLVSDLLQYAPGRFSLYQAGADWLSYKTSPGALRTPPDLADVDVRVVALERRDRGAEQTNAQSAFWTPYFDEAGARSIAWER